QIEKLLKNEQQLRKTALDYLIDDVLIKRAINQIARELQEDFTHEVGNQLGRFYQEITVSYVDNTSPLRSRDDGTVKNVKSILSIFLYRERFEKYLGSGGKNLEGWLKEQRKQEKDNITINYELAGIEAGRRGLMSFFVQ